MLDIQGIRGPAGSVFHNDLHVIVCFGTDYALLTVVIIIVQMSCKYKFPTLTKVTVVLATIKLIIQYSRRTYSHVHAIDHVIMTLLLLIL